MGQLKDSHCLEGVRSEYMSNFLIDEDFVVKVDREKMWKQVSAFYKRCINSPDRLKKKIVVEFSNVSGIGLTIHISVFETFMASLGVLGPPLKFCSPLKHVFPNEFLEKSP